MKYFYSFEHSRDIIRNLGLKSENEWKKYCKSENKDKNIPVNPNLYYKNEWKGMGDWLGTYNISKHSKIFVSYIECKLKVNELNIRTSKEWIKLKKDRILGDDYPYKPNIIYKENGWINWNEFLENKFLTFVEAREYCRNLNLCSETEWRDWRKNKPNFIPSNPQKIYKNDGWIGYHDWLGYNRNESMGESKIKQILERKSIIYEKEKVFKECKNIISLRFDFYIPSKNLCIEFDGIQHFKSFKNWGGDKTLKSTILNDSIKNNFCKENNIELLRIPYYSYNDIENILDII